MAIRVYITGAAGAGVSTLGRALAAHYGLALLDTDAYFWEATDPPFTTKRPADQRCALIAQDQARAEAARGWVLCGSADGWGDAVIDGAQLIVYLYTPTPIRLARLRRREHDRHGARIAPDGDMALIYSKFLKWAASYDDPYFSGRSYGRHQEWLSGQTVAVLRLEGTTPPAQLLDAVQQALQAPTHAWAGPQGG
ncbi:adenylate kinase [Rhodobacteraceae bacterium]|nr:adenylate kinase [Paracoccaceae bacterium]